MDRTVPREAPENAMLDKVDLNECGQTYYLNFKIFVSLHGKDDGVNLSWGGAQADTITFKAEKKKQWRSRKRPSSSMFPYWKKNEIGNNFRRYLGR